jgi:hypothetical protein
LQDFCRRTNSSFRTGAVEDIPAMIQQTYLNLLARFEIAYLPVSPNAPVLKVRVQTPVGWGETLIAAARDPEAPG